MSSREKLNVLIVEDEPLISIFIKTIVMDMGENIVGVCYNSDDAIEHLKLHKPDLIFMDINIKGPLDGISVIRTVPMPHNPTVFFVSAYSDKETINDALSTNPYNYIVKPIKEEDIEIAVILARKDQNKVVSPLENRITFEDGVYYDLLKQDIFSNNKLVLLSKMETKLLNLFIERINSSISANDIKIEIWGDKKVSDTTLRDSVSRLRKKVPKLNIQTNFGVGYTLTN